MTKTTQVKRKPTLRTPSSASTRRVKWSSRARLFAAIAFYTVCIQVPGMLCAAYWNRVSEEALAVAASCVIALEVTNDTLSAALVSELDDP